MASLELIAESIEYPFGLDPDYFPNDKIGANIRTHVAEIIH
jgi:putative membrane protein